MVQLHRGMYGTEFMPDSSLFDLQCGQMRDRRFMQNAGWYNKRGEKLGFGDIAEDDVKKISQAINSDELFVLLPEVASFWDFVVEEGLTLRGAHAVTDPAVEMPGEHYLAQHCRYLVGQQTIYYVDTKVIEPRISRGWPEVSRIISRDEALHLLLLT